MTYDFGIGTEKLDLLVRPRHQSYLQCGWGRRAAQKAYGRAVPPVVGPERRQKTHHSGPGASGAHMSAFTDQTSPGPGLRGRRAIQVY